LELKIMNHDDHESSALARAMRITRGKEMKGAEGAPLADLQAMLADPENEFEFSCYRYKPDTVRDERRILSLKGGVSGLAEARALLSQAMEGEELAIHSRITRKGEVSHIPMLDLACPQLGDYEMGRLERVLGKKQVESMRFYFSGRSFHAYGAQLIYSSEMEPFWGAALLANEPGKPQVVDARWVGHRMIAGYGSLRLSARSETSLCAPRAAWGHAN
jgi:hypothetical protein